MREGVRSGTFTCAHDIAEGGLAVALAECCIAGRIGASVELPGGVEPFGEALGRAFLVSGPEAALAGLRVIGRVGGSQLELHGVVRVSVSELAEAREHGLTGFV